MRRPLFRIIIRSLTVVSLLLFLATCVLWARSYRNVDVATYARGPRTSISVWSDSQRIAFYVGNTPAYAMASHGWVYERQEPASYEIILLGFEPAHYIEHGGFGVGSRNGAYRFKVLVLPDWLLLLIFGAVPARWLLNSVVQRRRANAGALECPTCGYDLRGTPDRCPECGRAAPTRPAAAPIL